MRLTITKTFKFSAAHRLMYSTGKCAHIHGHNYLVHVTLGRESSGHVDGMVADFEDVKREIGGWIDAHWDHGILLNQNDAACWKAINLFNDLVNAGDFSQKVWQFNHDPTAEIIACYLVESVLPPIAKRLDVVVEGVKVEETDTCSATLA